jgi:hypothetical protein
VLGGGVENLQPIASRAAVPSSVWPHYTYGPAEYGWVAQNGSGANTTGSKLAIICADPVAGYQVVESASLNYGPFGKAGWSCPAGSLVLGGGTQGVRPVTTRPAGPGTVTGFGYTYGENEYGWLAFNGDNASAAGARIVPVCATKGVPVDQPAPTPSGTDVPVVLLAEDGSPVAELVFANVTTAGATTVAPVASNDPAYVAPSGFALGDPPTYYDISTTAVFAGAIEICLSYPAGAFADGVSPVLLHFVNGAWANVTTSANTTTRIVCGSVTSLSPFALGVVLPVYTVSGFFSPVNTGGPNRAQAGQVVPLTFRVLDANGAPYASLTMDDVAVTSNVTGAGAQPTDQQEPFAGRSALQYLGDGYYQFNWRTAKAYANTTRFVSVTVSQSGASFEPNTITARFDFRK